MITEEQQDLAALYALGALDAAEAGDFERRLAADADLRELTRELRDAAASIALEGPLTPAPARLKERVLQSVSPPAPGKVTTIAPAWVPWAAAAALALCCGLLTVREGHLRIQLAGARSTAAFHAPDPLGQVSFCSLDPLPPEQPAPKAAIAWDRVRRLGAVRLNHFAAPPPGKDYQLWVVEEGVAKPVSAGVVRVGPGGTGQAVFKPVGSGTGSAQAFALSLEEAGGVPEGKGPILLMGKL